MGRRRASELYQVDFVAALFGGFLLVWLSNIGEAEFSGSGEGKPLVVFELSTRAFFTGAGLAGELDTSIIPLEAFRAACAHQGLVGILVKAGLEIFACEGTRSLAIGEAADTNILERMAEATARNIVNNRRTLSVSSAFASDFAVLFTAPSGELVPGRVVGAVFSGSGWWPRLAQVGVRPPAATDSSPPILRVSDWVHRSYLTTLADRRPLDADGVTTVDFYTKAQADKVTVVEAGRDRLERLEVQLAVVADGGVTRYCAKVSNGTSTDVPFENGPC